MRNTVRSAAMAAVTVLASLAWGTPGASALDATCMYPPSTPVLSIGLSTTAPVAGQAVYVRGRLTYNKCGVGATGITVRAAGKTIGTPKTDSVGNYSVRFTPLVKTSTYSTGSFNRVAVKSRTLGLAVRTNLRGTTAAAVGGCRVTIKGTVYPVRAGRSITISRRLLSGTKFLGWTSLGTTLTNSSGAYTKTVTLPCGSKAGVSTYIGPTTTNAANRSTTITVTAKA
jgi:hypothetical protein